MRRALSTLVSAAVLALGLTLLPAATAQAATISADAGSVVKSAGERYALRAEGNGLYVSADPNNNGRMTAKAENVGLWERFTLHTNHAGKNIGLRSAVTGFFATAEFGATGNYTGMMQARGGVLGSWQQFEVVSRESDGPMQIALRTVETGQYVSVEHASEGDDKDMLRARSASVGSWERFTLVPLGQQGTSGGSPAPASVSSSSLHVMTWNVCANNNPHCWDENLAGKDQVSAEIAARLPQPGGDGDGRKPDVIFFQEFCEKHAKPVEEVLEAATGAGWDVRFAPTTYALGELGQPVLAQYGVQAQKECAMADGLDRGAFGVALAVPESNTYYKGYTLDSPVSIPGSGSGTGEAKKAEQRPALCADLPSRALHICTSHFSAGQGYDDPSGEFRTKQAAQLIGIAEEAAAGYRPVFGGDLNSTGPDSEVADSGGHTILEGAYSSYRECEQLGDVNRPRTGRATAVPAKDGEPTMKIDHIFAPRNAPFAGCTVSATSGHSDHWTLYGTISLPAN
ncbi:endonuclease/exonuclease/phosphatase family protein [Streptomyces sp. NPDC102441]|uniref:endonuclease/exonuclease/phosphatase family protein n=1 Tax=Streptomyces sp. NPDC102441 TaxID=3366176 RepID=UPI0037F18AD3